MIPGRRMGFCALFLVMWLPASAVLSQTLVTPDSPPELNSDRPVQALYQLELYAAAHGWTSELALSAAQRCRDLGDLPRAIAFWELSARLGDPSAILLTRLAEGYLGLQRWSSAVIALDGLLRLEPDDPWANFEMGLLRLAQDWDGARRHLEKALADSRFIRPAGNLLRLDVAPLAEQDRVLAAGTLLAEDGLWAEAEQIFTQAVALNPSSAGALASLGLARDQQGKSGADQIRQAVALDPKNSRVRYLEGLHLRAAGDSRGSLAVLEVAAALDPTNPAYAAEVGVGYQFVGNFARAELWFRQALALSGGDPEFQAMLDTLLTGGS